MCGVEGGKGDNKEGGRIFPGVHQVREGPLCVTVTPQALDETQPSRQTLDDGTETVGVAVAHELSGTCNDIKQSTVHSGVWRSGRNEVLWTHSASVMMSQSCKMQSQNSPRA